MKVNKEKISEAVNNASTQLNLAKDAMNLILLGAGVPEAGVKLLDQKMSSVNEAIGRMYNITIEEIGKAEKREEAYNQKD